MFSKPGGPELAGSERDRSARCAHGRRASAPGQARLGELGAYSLGVDSPISLEYPNGRFHEATLTTSIALTPGDRFDLHGRHWCAVGLMSPPRGTREQRRMWCRSTSGLLRPHR